VCEWGSYGVRVLYSTTMRLDDHVPLKLGMAWAHQS
jgi:hypothetical protein